METCIKVYKKQTLLLVVLARRTVTMEALYSHLIGLFYYNFVMHIYIYYSECLFSHFEGSPMVLLYGYGFACRL